MADASEPPVPNQRFQDAAPADLQSVILRCLEKHPDRRYRDAASLDKALAACACAGGWTPERAEAWWRRQGDRPMPASSPEPLERGGQTVAAAW